MTRDQIAAMMKMEKQDVRLIYVEGAGCYGRNGTKMRPPRRRCWRRKSASRCACMDAPGRTRLGSERAARRVGPVGGAERDGTVAAWRY